MKTHCVNGHEFTVENTYIRKNGWRYCRKCHAEQQNKSYKNNPDSLRNSNIKKNYGITLEEYNNLLKLQNGVCAICKRKPEDISKYHKNLAIDHSHKTNRVRGLLCGSCNNGLGRFADNVERLLAAIEYLKENK